MVLRERLARVRPLLGAHSLGAQASRLHHSLGAQTSRLHHSPLEGGRGVYSPPGRRGYRFFNDAEREDFEERAAIIEYEAEKPRDVAEYLAYNARQNQRRKRSLKTV